MGNLREFNRDSGEFIFELCWQLTLSDAQSAVKGSDSILDLAEIANPDLKPTLTGWITTGLISRHYYPNVINTDACEESVTKAVELSLSICKLINA